MKRAPKKSSQKWSGQYELLSGVTAAASAVLIISIFLGTSLDSVLIRSQQYAAVVASALVDMANTDRLEKGTQPLVINPILVAAAQMKANDMAERGYFAHVSPAGVEPWHWFKEAGYNFSYAGENLAIDFSDSRDVNTAWMNSPTHRANILDGHYTEIGIAIAQGMYQGRLTTFVVQEFGTPAKTQESTPINAMVPTQAEIPATAVSQRNTVLGESVALAQKKKTLSVETSAPTSAVLAASASRLPHARLVEKIAASPRTLMHWLYYSIAVILLALLAIAAEFEFHARHLKKAYAAGGLFALMLLLALVGDRVIFEKPIISPSAMSAAVGIVQR